MIGTPGEERSSPVPGPRILFLLFPFLLYPQPGEFRPTLPTLDFSSLLLSQIYSFRFLIRPFDRGRGGACRRGRVACVWLAGLLSGVWVLWACSSWTLSRSESVGLNIYTYTPFIVREKTVSGGWYIDQYIDGTSIGYLNIDGIYILTSVSTRY